MPRKTYSDLHELIDDLDHESPIDDDADPLDDDDLERLRLLDPTILPPKPPKTPRPPKKRKPKKPK